MAFIPVIVCLCMLPFFALPNLNLPRELSVLPFTIFYGSAAYETVPYFCETNDGGFLISAITEVNGNKDIIVMKISANGQFQWAKIL